MRFKLKLVFVLTKKRFSYSVREIEEMQIDNQLGKDFDSRRIEYKIDLKLFIYNCFENLKIHIIKNLWI